MGSTPDIDIRPDHWEIVRAILQKHVPQYEVWAFGSRAKWTAKEFSDLDLAIITDEPLPEEVNAALNEAFEESDLPYKVDVVDWDSIRSDSQRSIEYLSQFKILLPPLRQKRAIAHILGTIDDKIELNRRMNETLEAMAHTISKDGFVDFGPVRAKPDKRCIDCFEEVASALRIKIENNKAENQTLAQLRDTLLPKLVSGELRIKDADKFVGQVV